MIKQLLSKVQNKIVLKELVARRSKFTIVTTKGILNLTEISKAFQGPDVNVTPAEAWTFLKGMYRVHRVDNRHIVGWLQDLYNLPFAEWMNLISMMYETLQTRRIKGHTYVRNMTYASQLIDKHYPGRASGVSRDCAVATWAVFFYIMEWHLKLRPVFNAPPIYLKMNEIIPLLGNVVLDNYYNQLSTLPVFDGFKFDDLGSMDYENVVLTFRTALMNFIGAVEKVVVPPADNEHVIQGRRRLSLAVESVADACAHMLIHGKYQAFDHTIVDHEALFMLLQNVTFLDLVISRLEFAQQPNMLSNEWASDLRIVMNIFQPSEVALYTVSPLNMLTELLDFEFIENHQRWLKLVVVRVAAIDTNKHSRFFYRYRANGIDDYYELRSSHILDNMKSVLSDVAKFGGTQIFEDGISRSMVSRIERQSSPNDPSIAYMTIGVNAVLSALGYRNADELNFDLDAILWLRLFLSASEIEFFPIGNTFDLVFRVPLKQSRAVQFETLLNTTPAAREALRSPYDKLSLLSSDVILLTLYGDIVTSASKQLFHHPDYDRIVYGKNQLDDENKPELAHLSVPTFDWVVKAQLCEPNGTFKTTNLTIKLMDFFHQPLPIFDGRIPEVYKAVHPMAVFYERIHTQLVTQLALSYTSVETILLVDILLEVYGPDSPLANHTEVKGMVSQLMNIHAPANAFSSPVYIEYNRMVLRAAIANAAYLALYYPSSKMGKPEYKYSAAFTLHALSLKQTFDLLDVFFDQRAIEKGKLNGQ